MKRTSLLIVVFLVMQVGTTQAGVVGYLENFVPEKIEEQSPGIWGIEINDNYVPKRGGIKICKAEKALIVGFYLSGKNMEFYGQKFSNGERKPLGFEIEVIDHDGVFDSNPLLVETSSSLLSGVLYGENHLSDSRIMHTVAIRNPTQLNAEKWYFVKFHFPNHREVTPGRFEIQIQLVGDMGKLRRDYSELYAQYSEVVRVPLTPWLIDNYSDPGSMFFNVREPRGSVFWGDEFFVQYDRVLWHMGNQEESYCGKGLNCSFEPGYCGFGSDPWEVPEGWDTSQDPGSGSDSGSGDQTQVPDPEDPNPPPPPPDSDLHIKDFHLAIYSTGNYEHRIEKTLYPGQYFRIEGRARIENDSGAEAKDIDSDYRVDHGKNFDTDDTKIDEDKPFDLDPHETTTKKMSAITISLSQDGQTVKVQGPSKSKSFPVENGFCKIYFFVDVEDKDDKDISSGSDKDEYGVVEVTTKVNTGRYRAPLELFIN